MRKLSPLLGLGLVALLAGCAPSPPVAPLPNAPLQESPRESRPSQEAPKKEPSLADFPHQAERSYTLFKRIDTNLETLLGIPIPSSPPRIVLRPAKSLTSDGAPDREKNVIYLTEEILASETYEAIAHEYLHLKGTLGVVALDEGLVQHLVETLTPHKATKYVVEMVNMSHLFRLLSYAQSGVPNERAGLRLATDAYVRQDLSLLVRQLDRFRPGLGQDVLVTPFHSHSAFHLLRAGLALEQALRHFKIPLKEEGDLSLQYFSRVDIWDYDLKWEEVEATYQQFFRKFPSLSTTFHLKIGLGEMAFKRGRFAQAQSLFEEVLAHPSPPPFESDPVRLVLGEVYDAQKEPGKALRIYEDVAQKSTFPFLQVEALQRRARIYEKQEKIPDALREYQRTKAFEKPQPNFDFIRGHIIEAYLRTGYLLRTQQPDTAVQEFQHVIATYPESREAVAALYEVGRTREQQGRSEDALKAYERLIRERPRYFLAHKARLQAAQIYLQDRNQENGRAMAQNLLEDVLRGTLDEDLRRQARTILKTIR